MENFIVKIDFGVKWAKSFSSDSVVMEQFCPLENRAGSSLTKLSKITCMS